MKILSAFRFPVAAMLALAVLSVPAAAQEMTNLQVLSSDMSRGQVTGIMRGFTSALGVRCSTCHMGEEGQPLNTYDFASDDKVNKVKAREMMRMVQQINQTINALPDRSAGNPTVTCATCHGGARVPQPIGDLIAMTAARSGVEDAATRYQELREQYFGGRQYDFTEGALLGIGNSFLEQENFDAAERFFGLSLGYFEGSWGGHLGLGQAAEGRGNIDAARMHYGHVLERDPENRVATRALAALGGGN